MTPSAKPTIALVLSGGGARGAYQAGVLKGMADFIDDSFPFRVITGVSAGAINAAAIASAPDTFRNATRALEHAWLDLSIDQVFKTSVGSLSWSLLRWLWLVTSGGICPDISGLFDTRPLYRYLSTHLRLHGVDTNVDTGRLRALALSTTCYSTGRTITFVHGSSDIETWERARRCAVRDKITVQHVMASAALPILFPAIQLQDGYYGDGSIRQSSPLAPAIHLGANRLLTISLRYGSEQDEQTEQQISGRPPPAQILGLMLHSIFLDALENDAERLMRINRTLQHVSPDAQAPDHLRSIDLFILRPSQNLGKLAYDLARSLPYTIRTIASGLGSSNTKSPDFLSYLLFERAYIERLLELGYQDAHAYAEDIKRFFSPLTESG
ncbi:MAG: patatin-like phospholipase family protein [Candidatus Tectomicrobia bacterium]